MIDLMVHEESRRAQSFGQDAQRYERARPSYPTALIDELVGGPCQRVLDVGCGTGKAARLLAARGCHVLGVEPDERMAAAARSYGIPVGPAPIAAITARGVFEIPELRAYVWERRYSVDEWLDQLGTHSDHLLLPPGQYAALMEAVGAAIDELGGGITIAYHTELIVARRRDYFLPSGLGFHHRYDRIVPR